MISTVPHFSSTMTCSSPQNPYWSRIYQYPSGRKVKIAYSKHYSDLVYVRTLSSGRRIKVTYPLSPTQCHCSTITVDHLVLQDHKLSPARGPLKLLINALIDSSFDPQLQVHRFYQAHRMSGMCPLDKTINDIVKIMSELIKQNKIEFPSNHVDPSERLRWFNLLMKSAHGTVQCGESSAPVYRADEHTLLHYINNNNRFRGMICTPNTNFHCISLSFCLKALVRSKKDCKTWESAYTRWHDPKKIGIVLRGALQEFVDEKRKSSHYEDDENKLIKQFDRKLLRRLRHSYKVGTFPLEALGSVLHVLEQFDPSLNAQQWKIYDPCAGWGCRAIASMALSPRVTHYVGVDPNSSLIDVYQEIKEEFKSHSQTTVKHIIDCAEDFTPERIYEEFNGSRPNLIFTSPPYGVDKGRAPEIYSDDPGQSINRYPERQQWKEKFLYAMLDNCCQALAPGGFMVINIASSSYYVNICEDLLSHVRTSQCMQYLGCLGLKLSTFNPDRTKIVAEPIFIWRKNMR